MKNKDIQEQNYIYFKLGTDNLLDEWGNPKRFEAYPQVTARVGWWDENDRIKGISFRVCQEHYDNRVHRGIVSTDEIVPKNECPLCKKNKL